MTPPLLSVQKLRSVLEKEFVGLTAASTSVKPVHVANGLYRRLLGRTSDTKHLNQFVFTQLANGEIPKGHDIVSVIQWLEDQERLEPGVEADAVRDLRVLLRKLVSVDNGVFLHKDRMESYSAGHASFVTDDRTAFDAGEFVGEWLKRELSPLRDVILEALQDSRDPIYMLCSPWLSDDNSSANRVADFDKLKLFHEMSDRLGKDGWKGLRQGAVTLAKHLAGHPNKLYRLRLSILYACFVILRHMSMLESVYLGERVAPLILLDFSSDASTPVARASALSYARACQSITRFYAWAYGYVLKSSGTGLMDLGSLKVVPKTPKAVSDPEKLDRPEYREIWREAEQEVRAGVDPYTAYGQACYDIAGLGQEGDPVRYFRALAVRSGLAWPPENLHPAKRFVPTQDMLEVLVRAAIEPGQVVSLQQLQSELFSRFGVVVGGRSDDEEALLRTGISSADGQALSQNQEQFVVRLTRELSFARVLADGVLEVRAEV